VKKLQRRVRLRAKREEAKYRRNGRTMARRAAAEERPETEPRWHSAGERVMSTGLLMQVGAIIAFIVMWFAFEWPYAGAVVAAVLASAGFVAFWVGATLMGLMRNLRSWFGLWLAVATAGAPTAFIVGVATGIAWLSALAGIVLVAGGLFGSLMTIDEP
jgi:hypothetical protein